MQILLEAHSLLPPRTGIGRYSETLVRGLVQHSNVERVSLLLSVFPFSRNWASSLRSIQDLSTDLRVHRIPLPYGWLQTLWNTLDEPKVDRWIRSVDVIHGPGHVLPSRRHAAGVITVHDTTLLEHPEWYPQTARQFAQQIQIGILQADRVIVPSESVRKKLSEYENRCRSKIAVILHEIQTQGRPIPLDEKAAYKQEILGVDFPYLFWNGEVNPRKNVPVLFHTLRELRKLGHKDLRLIMVGSLGFQSHAIMQEAEPLGLSIEYRDSFLAGSKADVVHYGFVPDDLLSLLLSGAEVFLFPSWDEGFGYPVLEAMASGVPVVCSSTGSLAEISQDSAWLVDPHLGMEPFVQAVSALLTDHERYCHYQTLGLERQQAFRHNGMVDRTVQVYQEALLSR